MMKKYAKVDERVRSIAAVKTGPVAFVRQQNTPRTAERQQTFRYGVVHATQNAEYPCIIKDLSADGARIALEGDIGLPPIVDFKVQTTPGMKRAAIVWQNEREVGLSFDIAGD
ncbi:MAG: PilZ domain-containing protein [Parvularculaceae bacterium]